MSSEGSTRRQPSIRGDAPSYSTIFVYFQQQKSIFNSLDVVFGEIFLLLPINSTQILFKMCDQFCSQSRHWSCD